MHPSRLTHRLTSDSLWLPNTSGKIERESSTTSHLLLNHLVTKLLQSERCLSLTDTHEKWTLLASCPWRDCTKHTQSKHYEWLSWDRSSCSTGSDPIGSQWCCRLWNVGESSRAFVSPVRSFIVPNPYFRYWQMNFLAIRSKCSKVNVSRSNLN